MDIHVKQLKKDIPIFIIKLPKEIIEEIDKWIVDCKKIKEHKLSYLKQHDNVGTSGNAYQISIPKKHIDDGFFLSFLVRFCSKVFGGPHRDYYMREWSGHFDGYDIWANFAYEGNYNEEHNHQGFLSGVIYHKNEDLTETIFPEHDIKYTGDEGTMALFPSKTIHKVEPQKSKKERITIAFNLLNGALKNQIIS